MLSCYNYGKNFGMTKLEKMIIIEENMDSQKKEALYAAVTKTA